MDIPVIDISAFDGGGEARARIAREWDQTFRTAGFCSLVGHGIAANEALYRSALDFFALPLAQRRSFIERNAFGGRYIPLGGETVGRAMGMPAQPDLLEVIEFPDLHRGSNGGVPDEPATMRVLHQLAEAYALEASALIRKLTRISAVALDLPEGYFDGYYTTMTSMMRFSLYPDQVEEPLPGQLRNAAHTDFGGFTLLRQDNAPGGLQVCVSGEWIDVRPVDGALVVNTGDLIARWTNDRWRSNLHRVVNPPRALAGSAQRLSIILFSGPNPDAEIACLPSCCSAETAPKYAPVRASEYVGEKVRLTLGLSA
jgi:isopenicillin N synthase-like dioxygenase